MCSWEAGIYFHLLSLKEEKKTQKPSSNGIWMGIQPASCETALGTSVPYTMQLKARHVNVSKKTDSLLTCIGIYEELSLNSSEVSWCTRPLFVFLVMLYMNLNLGQYLFLPTLVISNGLSGLTVAVSACTITALSWAEQGNAPSSWEQLDSLFASIILLTIWKASANGEYIKDRSTVLTRWEQPSASRILFGAFQPEMQKD